MDRDRISPSDLAEMPSTCEEISAPYDWKQQTRDLPTAGKKQTFDGMGRPNDSTDGRGSTEQTFDGSGRPNDSRFD